MTHITTLREDLALLKRKGDVTGPLALFLDHVLDKIEELERPASAIRPGFFDSAKAMPKQMVGCSVCYGLNPHGCPVCVTRREWAIGAKA